MHRLPLLAINHLEAHALTARLTDGIAFPYLLLLVSGGHCQLLVVEGVGRYRRLGTTLDDALGEAFDKAAKMLGLGFPGGPAVERAARAGDPPRFALPRPMLGQPGCHFSFSGLKTALRQTIERLGPASARAAAAERSVRELPGGGRRHPGRSHARGRRRCFRDASYPAPTRSSSRAASPRTRTCARRLRELAARAGAAPDRAAAARFAPTTA